MPHPTRRLLCLLMLLALLCAAALPPAAILPAAIAEARGVVQLDPQLEDELEADESAGYLVVFDERPDLSEAYRMSWRERGRYVVAQLQQSAARAQKRTIALLKGRGARYKSYWAGNLIVVERSNRAVVDELRKLGEIAGLYSKREIVLFDAEQARAATALPATPLAAVESNLSRVKAPDVWGLGYDGEGIVVGSMDTGVRYTHQTLVGSYRGNLGGSFDHNYSWWDPYDQTSAPVDTNNHGSHTTGIMVGDDGTNQIGVAPGATWIACMGLKGNSGTEEALIECGQFMLAPWNLSKQNANPDKRPHIVNNSWGSCDRAYDGWYQGVVDAWLAAGIYPVFSQGNAGNCGYMAPPPLNTVGGPGRYGNVTAVGATSTNNGQYAVLSNKGPTDKLDTVNPRGYANLKPQVVAPGVGIRSAIKTNDSSYSNFNGTSMAAPHVSGALALMWQAAPCLVGDYASSETLLEQSATPIPYATGNGDEGPGNVPNHATGWGELNALKAVDLAQQFCSSAGVLKGTVTDSASSQPLAGVQILATLSPTQTWGTLSDAQGTYTMTLMAGSYSLSASLFAYNPYSQTNLLVSPGITSTHSFALTPVPRVVVSGTVSDSAGHGWPLYARVDVAGPSAQHAASTFTNPATGVYSVTLLMGQPYTFTVSAIAQGYLPALRAVTPSGAGSEDFGLMPTSDCIAPGYAGDFSYLADFEDTDEGYTVSGTNASWEWGAPTSGPGSAFSGSEVWASNLTGNYNNNETSYLTSPAIDLSAYAGSELLLSWWQWLRTEDTFDKASLEVSKNNGASWSRVYGEVDDAVSLRWEKQLVELDSSYAVAGFRLRFHLSSDGSFQREGWYVDDIGISENTGLPPCLVLPGALLLGFVSDANTGLPLDGATVWISGTVTTGSISVPTPDDPALPDGFYSLFYPATGAVVLGGEAWGYAVETRSLTLDNHEQQRQDLALPAPLASLDPQELTLVAAEGQQLSRTLALENAGGAATQVDLWEYAGSALPAYSQAVRLPSGISVLPWENLGWPPLAQAYPGAALAGDAIYLFGGLSGGAQPSVQRYDLASQSWRTDLPAMPRAMSDSCAVTLGNTIYLLGGYLGSNTVTSTVQIYDSISQTWQLLASDPLPAVRSETSCAVHDGKLYLFGGIDNSSTAQSSAWAYDPAAPAGSRWSARASLPKASLHGQAAVVGDTIFYAGMQHPGESDIVVDLYAYWPLSDSWTLYSTLLINHERGMLWALDGALYVGGGDGDMSVLRYDLAQGAGGSWTTVGMLIEQHREGIGLVDTQRGQLYAVGGNIAASPLERMRTQEVPWLSASAPGATLAAQGALPITLEVDTSGLAPGGYQAQLLATLRDTPYALAHPAMTITLQIVQTGLAASPASVALTGFPGALVTHSLTITNTGDYTDSFSLALGAHSWPATPTLTMIGPLAPGASANLQLAVRIPHGVAQGASDSISLTLTSALDPQRQLAVTRGTSAIYHRGYLPMVRRR